MNRMTVGGRSCFLEQVGRDGPVLLFPMGTDGSPEKEAADMARQLNGCNGLLTVFPCDDWNRELSPWPAPGLRQGESFEGGGQETLDWIAEKLCPALPDASARKRMIGGYSLAGLFALWAFLKTDLFCGAASCSGSLWFPGFADFREKSTPPAGGVVYLSLGRREEKSRNPLLGTVGAQTRDTFAWCQRSRNIADSTLVWQDGGHFDAPEERTAAGLRWLLSHGAR